MKRYDEEIKIIVDDIKKDINVLGIWVIGPFDSRKEKGDMHMVVIVEKQEGIIYKHVRSHFSGIARRLEIGYFPKDYFINILKSGYDAENMNDIEKLRDIIPLHQKYNTVTMLKKRFKKIKASNIFIGMLLNAIKSNLSNALRFINTEKYINALLSVRKCAGNTSLLLLLGKYNVPSPKLSYLHQRIKRHSPEILGDYEKIQGVEDMDKKQAFDIVNNAVKFAEHVFDELGINRVLIY